MLFMLHKQIHRIIICSIFLFLPLKETIAQSVTCLPNPKNIIILIGDGMGYNHIKAANYYLGKGQQEYEKFPVCLAMSHYPAKAGTYKPGDAGSNYWAHGYNALSAWTDTAWLKKDVTESSAAATALATGIKTYNGSIGMSVDHDTLVNLVEWAKSFGKSAGVVTSVPFSHATPAGFVAHNIVRSDYSQIAYQMILDSRCDVIMGCGDPMFNNDGQSVKSVWNNPKYVGDSIFWLRLIEGSGTQIRFEVDGKMKTVKDINGDGTPDPWQIVRSPDEFRNLMQGETPQRVLGVPHVYSTLQQSRTIPNGETKDSPPFRTPLIATVPSLAEMAGGAMNVLDNNPKGFFLMIEGGAIDWASHDNQKGRLIEEMISFNDAVVSVLEWVKKKSNWKETLVIITGDHETGLLWGEEPFYPLVDRGIGQIPFMEFHSTDHTNSLIPFFSKGPGSDFYRNFADEQDSIRGGYIQNSEIVQLIHILWPR